VRAYGEASVKGFSTRRIIFFSSFMSIMHAYLRVEIVLASHPARDLSIVPPQGILDTCLLRRIKQYLTLTSITIFRYG